MKGKLFNFHTHLDDLPQNAQHQMLRIVLLVSHNVHRTNVRNVAPNLLCRINAKIQIFRGMVRRFADFVEFVQGNGVFDRLAD